MLSIILDPAPLKYKEINTEDEKRWQIEEDTICTIALNPFEKFEYNISKGFELNFRSGPDWLNNFIPKIGTPAIALSWLIHDINYEGYLSQQRADSLLYYMLVEGGLPKLNSQFVYVGLRTFGSRNYIETRSSEFVKFVHTVLPRPTPIKTRSLESFQPKETTIALDQDLQFDKGNEEEVYKALKEIAPKEYPNLKEEINKYYK